MRLYGWYARRGETHRNRILVVIPSDIPECRPGETVKNEKTTKLRMESISKKGKMTTTESSTTTKVENEGTRRRRKQHFLKKRKQAAPRKRRMGKEHGPKGGRWNFLFLSSSLPLFLSSSLPLFLFFSFPLFSFAPFLLPLLFLISSFPLFSVSPFLLFSFSLFLLFSFSPFHLFSFSPFLLFSFSPFLLFSFSFSYSFSFIFFLFPLLNLLNSLLSTLLSCVGVGVSCRRQVLKSKRTFEHQSPCPSPNFKERREGEGEGGGHSTLKNQLTFRRVVSIREPVHGVLDVLSCSSLSTCLEPNGTTITLKIKVGYRCTCTRKPEREYQTHHV